MNKIQVITTAVVAICILVRISFAAQISVVPAHQTVSKSENFTVDIYVDPEGSEVFGAQYELHFDKSLLNVTSQTKGPFLGNDASMLKNERNNTMGWVKYGEIRTGYPGVTNQGVLATISFTAMDPGTSSLNLNEVKLSDPTAKQILDVLINDGTCKIKAIEQTPTPGGGGSGNGGASVASTPTPSPTTTPSPTPEPTVTPTKIPVTLPDSTITPASTPTLIPTVVSSSSPFPVVTTSPTPISMLPSEGEKQRLSGFGVISTMVLLLTTYVILKVKKKGDNKNE
jgi:hypothetical protein